MLPMVDGYTDRGKKYALFRSAAACVINKIVKRSECLTVVSDQISSSFGQKKDSHDCVNAFQIIHLSFICHESTNTFRTNEADVRCLRVFASKYSI